MLKIAAVSATALCAGILCTTPYSLSVTPQGSVSLSLNRAAALIGHPLTPMSVAGVHRRAMRRTYGVGANLGYGAGYGGWGGYGYHPVARAALYGAAATGAGYYGAGYGGWGGYNQEPLKSQVIDAAMRKSCLDRTFDQGPCEIISP